MTPQVHHTFTTTPAQRSPGLQRIEDLTRREFISSALAGALLIACGDDDEADPTATPVAPAIRTIDTAMGPVEIPASPKRIVAADTYTLQVLDELGAPLVAAATFADGSRVRVSDAALALPSVGWWELDLEAVQAAAPDLIVGITEWQEENYALLSQIAPTVLLSYNTAPDWRQLYLTMAEPASLGVAAQTELRAIDGRLEDLRAGITAAWPDGVTVTVLRVRSAEEIESYTSKPKNITSLGILNELEGVTISADSLPDAGEEVKVDLSMERLRDADADVIFYYIGGGDNTGMEVTALTAMLEDSPLWQGLAAVQAGRAYAGDPATWFDAVDIAGANLVIDDLEKNLT